ncbi:MAG TPA: hypothetical protein VED01_21200 [Burkholderiales bacterium]|nr:hypothetical protein [Burkholderiales bacterium]
MAETEDAWDPLADPAGENALKPGEQLTANERRSLLQLSNGGRLRDIEIDRLVTLGLAERDRHNGEPTLTQLGQQVLKSAA